MLRIFLLVAACLPALPAAEICPFMNAATAGGILEGPVDAAVAKNYLDGTCLFARQNSPATLKIEVVTMGASRAPLAAYKTRCTTPPTALKAIGNEAAVCELDKTSQQVAGRVRKQAFTVIVSGKFPPEALRQKAVNAAEQVAGSLF